MVESAHAGLAFPDLSYAGLSAYSEPVVNEAPASLEVRWVIYDALGGSLGVAPEPLGFESTINRWDVGAFKLVYSLHAAPVSYTHLRAHET